MRRPSVDTSTQFACSTWLMSNLQREDGARDPRWVVSVGLRWSSPTNAARCARPVFRSFFPAWDARSC